MLMNICKLEKNYRNNSKRLFIDGSSKMRETLKKLLFLTILILSSVGAWAQTDYSGTYYIASVDYDGNPSNTDNYYLCPTEGWIYYKATDNWDADGTTYPNPFLTTYKCKTPAYISGAANAVWIIQKHETEDYYYIIHKSDGKYMTSNGQISGTTNANRMRVHIETVTSDPDDRHLFSITPYPTNNPTYLVISPKSSAGWNSDYKWYTVNDGNKNYLVANGKDGGPTGHTATGGILGTYSQDDKNAKFYLEDLVKRPSIAYNTSSLIEITDQTGSATKIYYTTDGSTPTTSSTEYTAPFDFADNMTTVKAIAIVGGEESNVAVFTPVVHAGSSHVRLIQSQNNAWGEDFHFYMVPGDEENSKTMVNTTSLFRPSMEWYFLGAGMEDGEQYYYIVNNANGKYICYDANTVYMEAFGSGGDKFKFKIVESADGSSFNIIPYVLRAASGNTNRFLCKPNEGSNVSNTNAKAIALNNASNVQSNWKFILPSTLDKTAPFDVPDGTGTSYYKIASVGSSGYYIVPPSGNATNVTTSNSSGNTMNWYFEVAQASTSSDWCTYYHIRNALTGDYMYFTKDANNAGACLEMRSTIVAENADRYMFTWARTASDGQYYIIPKLLKDAEQNRISTFWRDNGNLKTILTRQAGNYAWTFNTVDFCNDPVITQAVGRAVSISCLTSGATIYYTTDGTEPATSVTASTNLYNGAFTPAATGVDVIKAIAVNQGTSSAVVTFTLPKYTYKIVNKSDAVAISSAPVQQAAGTPISGYTSIPAEIRSEYLSGETVKFYSFSGDFDKNKLIDENLITETPSESANIYVTYTTEHLSERFLPLTNANPYNIKTAGGDYLYYTSSALGTITDAATSKTENEYLWNISGEDPYNMTLRNMGARQYYNYDGSAASLNASSQPFILMGIGTTEEVATGITAGNVTLRTVSGAEITLRVNTVVLPLSFTLIDKAFKLIQSGIGYDGSFELPAAWRSPLVSEYKYYKRYASLTDGIYTFEEADRIYRLEDRETNTIYVTYDVNDLLDLDGRNLLGAVGKEGGKTYMLKFASGTAFKQEDGSDGVMADTRTPVYPYSNGDAHLYVYGEERWQEQLASGASTRARWLWYLEPAGAQLDPYHVRISSYSTQTNYKDAEAGTTTNFHSYLRTYKPSDYSSVVTGVTNDNPLAHGGVASSPADKSDATEYMLIGASLNSLKLITTSEIDGAPANSVAAYGTRQTVNSFEQYWKNNPTAYNIIKAATGAGVLEGTSVNADLSSAQQAALTAKGWHVYSAWANAADWSSNPKLSKHVGDGKHWFETVAMGDGSMTFVDTELATMLILLDQHGWEIARVHLPSGPTDPNRAARYREIHKYSSPMVARYHFWKTGSKVPGYHKYKVSDYATVSDVDLTEYTADELGREDITVKAPNLPNYETQAKVGSAERDWYVTYDVKPEYANAYGALPTSEGSASPFLLKQGGKYAKINGTSIDKEASADLEDTDYHWYLKPNFNIDEEMGYLYDVKDEEGNPISKDDTNLGYYDDGKAGFDPYNLQIQSVSNTARYFTANTSGSTPSSGVWAGTSSAITLENLGTQQAHVMGHDQADMNITNATFMVVDDGNGNMRLMPRFDHGVVMDLFTGLAGQDPKAPANDNGAADQSLAIELVPKVVHSSSEIGAMGGTYVLAPDFTSTAPIGTAANPFVGSIDGQLNPIALSNPLVAYADGAVIKNVILESASISSGNDEGDAGAICCAATGNTRIYNCGILSGSVSGTHYTGGIVGRLVDYSRVINCYSYANITGGTEVGGIVGYNEYASTAANLHTMVMNCMFYGNITGATTVAPVYGGLNINNLKSGGLNTYNYYAYDILKGSAINKYNCALGVEEKFLTRFEFYRQLLNSNHPLAAYYATGSKDNAGEMAKWVLETADRSIINPKPYPVLRTKETRRKDPSIINYDITNAPDSVTVGRNHGGKLGKTLSVTISGVGTGAPDGASITIASPLYLQRTDKDFDRFNFNYDKVQLPYYNDVGTGNYTKNKVVTGWKITGFTGGTAGTFTAADTWGGYNFADRKSTNKDLYGTGGSNRVFSQGAYFDVPYGVTGITIEPYWGKAAYVSDEYMDVVHDTGYGVENVTQLGRHFGTNKTKVSINGDLQEVHTSINSALDSLSGATVYDNAVVLVGNVHQGSSPSAGTKPFTLMSADLDFDNEPDNSLILSHNGRKNGTVSPIRFDFLNVPGIAMAQKPNGATTFRNVSIYKPKGWFEVTNTCNIYFVQFECDNGDKSTAPVILLGGLYDQFVSTQSSDPGTNTSYIHIGGNAWFKDFGNGTHSDGKNFTPHIPISVTGGDFEGFYLSGTYRPDATVKADNAECYISGGRFNEVAGAAQQQIDGNVQWKIYNADITDFYGGGVNADNPVTGNITIDITGSHVGTFCGGPKFGNMTTGKEVTTRAVECTFDYFFGAGYGGISYNRVRTQDKTGPTFNSWQSDYTNKRGKYLSNNKGVATDFDYEFFVWSTGETGGRFYVKYSSLSTAQTKNVSSTLTDCHINRHFYGGGKLGNVDGTATSVLNGCTVEGNVFGGGYSAEHPTVPIRSGGFTTIPKIDTNAGVFDMGEMTATEDYTLVAGTLVNDKSAINTTAKTIITDVDLNSLGQVTHADLTISGNTIVRGKIFDENGDIIETTGGVFGGGDMSAVNGNTKVDIQNTENTEGILNVFGGGNTANVVGNTEVILTAGTVLQDVYGGGKGETTVVSGDVVVNIGTKTGESAPYTYTGTSTVIGSVYGGSAYGAVNATKNPSTGELSLTDGKQTVVNLYGCTSIGNVFGGGLGQEETGTPGDSGYKAAIAAQNFGNTTVNMERATEESATVKFSNVTGAVYGGANVNGVLKQDATVTLLGGTVGTVPGVGERIKDAVFGGGKGEATLVEGNVTMNIGTKIDEVHAGNATINGNVYGGSALGSTNAESSSSFHADKTTTVNLFGGTIKGDAYGGGLGQKKGVNDATSDIVSYVGGDVLMLLDSAKITGNVFGCNNLNGTPKGHVKVWVMRTINIDDEKNALKSDDTTPLADRTTYDVAAVYGGGNQADYVPTDALLVTTVGEVGYDAGNQAKVDNAFAEVLIEGCEKTSIQYVYGGGNAAAVPATQITINEAYIIDQVFGGGNGAGEGTPGANVGIYDNDGTPTNYGTGIAKTILVGGQVHYVYGGSNTLGNVRGGTSLERKESNTCELKIGEIYGAGQVAPMDGDVKIELDCMPEEFVEAVYGGAKNAVVNGDVSLTVRSGKYGRVFGGNNLGGSINGSITVNVYEGGCDPLIIGELYGGGFQAPYSIYGCTEKTPGVWTANTSGDLKFDQVANDRAAIEVNVWSCTSIGKVFGGGFKAPVIGNTHVWINLQKGTVNEIEQPTIGKIGQVFGGGNAATVTGDVVLDIGTSTFSEGTAMGVDIERGTYTDPEHGTYLSATADEYIDIPESGIYGGGYSADVEGNTTLNIGAVDQTLGIKIEGNIFGGGYGETTTVTGDVVVNIGQDNAGTPVGYANITGDVYGGSAKGKVNATKGGTEESPTFSLTAGKETHVNFYGGALTGNIYGGGLGVYTDDGNDANDFAADVYGPVTVTVEGGSVTNAFGCNNVLGSPKSTAAVTLNGGTVAENIYGGGNQAAYNTGDSSTGSVSVTLNGGTVAHDVFGGGLGETAVVHGATSVTLNGGTVDNTIYGGGSLGDVTGAVTVALNGGTVAHEVYGGGALASTNTEYAAGSAPANAYVTNVTLAGATVTGDVYGGGLGLLAADAVGTEGEEGYIPAKAAVAANVGGPVTVTVTSGSATNVYGCNNINGAPQQAVAVIIGSRTGESAPYTYDGTATISGSVYGGGNVAAYTGNSSVTLYGGTVNTNVYGGGLGSTAIVTGNTTVTMEGGRVRNDVYGGGSQADVTGSVAVSISGGTVTHDVYGGGALANTNTANWALGSMTPIYVDITSALSKERTSVYGLYTKSGDVYTVVSDENAKASAETTYYERRMLPGTWAEGMTSASNTTVVKLTGGIIGNVYGGGLGSSTTPVYVFGDITLNVNHPADMTSASPGAAFTYKTETPTIDAVNYTPVPLTGNVFGCNNIKGTPLGNVTVGVYSTRQINETGEYVAGHSPNGVIKTYEIQTVYGGGNQADYLPAEGKGTHVIIDGCGETSISNVYGGGSAASVPATDVVIWGSYDIGYAFGGGNGFYKIKKDGVWTHNDGADVSGLAKITCHGGKIGEIFGGSDAKGNCRNPSSTLAQEGSCPLVLTKLYGAGKEADVDGDVNVVISACTEGNSEIEYVCGGSYKAHISGDVTLTITSGYFKNVFGGNDQRGGIGGNITVNIEETEDCDKPIIIQNLIGGSNRAEYPGEDKDGNPFPDSPRKITVNVKSATRIDNIFGGSFMAEANADTEVNINMNRGNKSGHSNVPLPSYYGEPGAQLPDNISSVAIGYEEVTGLTEGTSSVVGYYTRSGEVYTQAAGVAQSGTTYYKQTITGTIAPAIGTIGNVYGGGNEGLVKGNTVVNIGTSPTVPIMERVDGEIHMDKDGDKITKIYYTDEKVLGVHIDSDVFGGGYAADVTGNSVVNYCTTDYSAYSGTTGFEGFSIGGSIYGGGSRADIYKNTSVTMAGGYVFDGVYGGGLKGSVGTVETRTLPAGHTIHEGCLGGKPETYAANTGKCTVTISGGQVGPVEAAIETGGMKNTGRVEGFDGPVDVGFVFGAGRGEVESLANDPDADFRTYVKETEVIIRNQYEAEYASSSDSIDHVKVSPIIMASVYGGGENGRVRSNTSVKIYGGQIGCGEGKTEVNLEGKTVPKPYTESEWKGENSANFTECASWDFGKTVGTKKLYLPYDPFAPDDTEESEASRVGSDGHTYYGYVFGGGSGYFPYENADGTHDWLRSAGMVEGSTKVTITGGHILTSVYGGNELTDVMGDSCVVIMTGGTIGVPRDDDHAHLRPVTCYLFGGGKGDQRMRFYNWTNVQNTRVHVGGSARIFGSVFGGAEDGHVLGNTKVDIYGGKIGSTGTSYVDGNVFGGGRGFSGEALTAGSIGGNTTINIGGGTVLGSVYGGGRMASVGIDFTPADDPSYGQLVDETGAPEAPTYGHVTVNITGGTIGKDFGETTPEGMEHSGNVFGGSMGRNTLLDGTTINPLWPKIGAVKTTNVNISGTADIKRSVYGGSEFAVVRNRATVNIDGGTVGGSVFGGGYGSDDHTTRTVITVGGYASIPTQYFTFTPIVWNGCVSGNTNVNISGGTVKKNVYGGGYLASVGLINFNSDAAGNYNYVKKHEDLTNSFALSWPYEYQYIAAAPNDATSVDGGGGVENAGIGGKATVTVTGGRIGAPDDPTSGYVFGGSKGMAMERYAEAACANVKETEVTIRYGTTPTIDNATAADSHFATASNAGIQGAVYGGGEDGHVYQNAVVNITRGIIGMSVYGGGKGLGTYKTKLRNIDTGSEKAEEEDVYSWTAGKVYGNTTVEMTGGHVLHNIFGGGYNASVGKGNYSGGKDDYFTNGFGETLTDGKLWTSESEGDNAWHFLNSGVTTITVTDGKVGTPDGEYDVNATGQIYGGSRGVASRDLDATVLATHPRYEYTPDFYLGYANETHVTIGDAEHAPTIYGSVYGGGRDGLVRRHAQVTINNGTIGLAYNAGDVFLRDRGNVYGAGSGLSTYDATHHGTSSGTVAGMTTVTVNGGTIHQNVYGGGAMASVGPPKSGDDYATKAQSLCTVNINGGTIGNDTEHTTYGYGGNVFGSSRGGDFAADEFPDNLATTLWTVVNVNNGTVNGNVYGGGEAGIVRKDTEVNLQGGEIKHNAYGGGKGTTRIPADVGGNVTVLLNNNNNGGDVDGSKKGCIVDNIFGCNDQNGTPKGHVLVHVYGTQNRAADNMETKPTPLPTDDTSWDNYDYDVTAVYGGGDLAEYNPSSPTDYAQVIIDGCEETSIKQVYGGGNAAPVPATNVKVNSCFIINELFGGGNGLDNYTRDGEWYANPGANVGYHALAYYVTKGKEGYNSATHGTGEDEENRYKAITYDNATTKAERQNLSNGYSYGTGWATTTVTGGRINYVYGGSNQLGNIRDVALSQYQSSGSCPLITGKTYGGSKNAEIDAEIRVVMDCVDKGGTYYGGSANSDVNSNVTIDITNGTYEKVFGGNDHSGTVNGAITINIRESGCTPIIIGEIYGGGNEADYSVYGYNITRDAQGNVTGRTALKKGETGALATPHRDPQINIISATRIGNIYGGGYKARVIGSPHVNVNMEQGKVLAQYANKDAAAIAAYAVGSHGEGSNAYEVTEHPDGGDAMLAIGTIENIFGGGNLADIIGNSYVDIGTGQWLNASGVLETMGTDGTTYTYNSTSGKWEYDVAGVQTPFEGTPTPIRNAAFINGSVFGGGNLGHVGDFTLTDGKPTSCVEGTGITRVVISNGEIGPDNMQMTAAGGPDDVGHVFGAGKGTYDLSLFTGTESERLTAMANSAFVDSTEVIINGTAWVKGSVYGGGFDGHVLHNTGVKISGDCQIGNGDGVNRRYTDTEWANGKLDGVAESNSLPECAHWPYEAPYAAHDMYANETGNLDEYPEIPEGATDKSTAGGRRVASDGHTFYGNVFGGGSGYYPYKAGHWLWTAGQVEGSTWVEISGGHILTNIYGGNEMTNVLGDSHVSMTGGTLGVPRTVAEIIAHPVTCYLFGAGKGDQRIFFNKQTNVRNAYVNITGGTIYGSVFGGGEDGHVNGNVTLNIGQADGNTTKIGTWGTTYVEGNVFGGGRGFSGDAMTAGNVAGTVTLNITGGQMLGSVYGGGRLASVGYGLYLANEDGKYGVMQDDGYGDWYKNSSDEYVRDEIPGFKRGYVNIDISGGIIGNDLEYKYYTFDIETGDTKWSEAIEDAKQTAIAGLEAQKVTDNIPLTEFQAVDSIQSGSIRTYIYRLTHTRGGNVFAGGMGRLYSLTGAPIPYWFDKGNVKKTKLTIRQASESVPTIIKGNVYGGCEYGQVCGTHKVSDAYHRVVGTDEKDEYAWPETLTDVLITGGTIGSEVKDNGGETQYTYGSVFGGGFGDPMEKLNYSITIGETTTNYESNPKFSSGLVEGGTKVTMEGGSVLGSIFGGGQVANTHGNDTVTVTGGTVGMENLGDLRSGNVYGGGFGNRTIVRCGQIYGNSTVNISGTPIIRHNVYGGGAYGSVGQFKYKLREDPVHHTQKVYGVLALKTRSDLKDSNAPQNWPYGTTPAVGTIIEPDATGRATVTITGGTIGTDGLADGNVFGSAYGDVANPLQRDDYLGWVYDTNVTIGTSGHDGYEAPEPQIAGNVYGSGDNGHTFNDATVTIHSGTIGLVEAQAKDPEGEEGYKNPNRGNVFGAGDGAETYNIGEAELYKAQAGIVYGNTTVNVNGGLVVHNVYGGGQMASVGKLTNDPQETEVKKIGDEYKTVYKWRDTYQHSDEKTSFALSWPYEYMYHVDGEGNPTLFGTANIGGKATVNVSGGRIGLEGSYGGDVYGGSKGLAGDRYAFDDMANVRETEVNISYETTTKFADFEYDADNASTLTMPGIAGSVHGGAENGHVDEDTHVTLNGGIVAHSLYGGGKGKGTYRRTIKAIVGSREDEADVYSITAGKVYGNTYVTMNGGHVVRSVYGGGNMGSVGKGNYTGGADDYSTAGYGETITGNLWTPSAGFNPSAPLSSSNVPTTLADFFLSSGKTYVVINDGIVGYVNAADPSKSLKDGLPYGNVFGGSRGEAAPNVPEGDEGLERYNTCPAFYSGYVNETDVVIGDATHTPTIYGSVYGGGQDGHVRRWSHVEVNDAVIGLPFTSENQTLLQTSDANDPQWLYRGNVFGGGSGISQYQYDFDHNGNLNDTHIIDGIEYKETGYSTSSGSVTHFTTVDVKGGFIYRSVYGGGSLGSIGAPLLPPLTEYAARKTDTSSLWGQQSLNLVNIGGAVDGEGKAVPVTIGEATGVAAGYGGHVFGGSRGNASLGSAFGTSIWTEVNLKNGSNVLGNVFGGGDAGEVKKDTEVNIGN